MIKWVKSKVALYPYLLSYISLASEPSSKNILSISSLTIDEISSEALNLTHTPQLELSFLGTGMVSEGMPFPDKNLL